MSTVPPRPAPLPEETLDPHDWREFRAVAHRALDDMLTYLETVRERPVWQPVPAATRRALAEPLPRKPQGVEAAYRDFVEHVLPYPTGNIHPRFWGWVNGTGSPLAMVAEMLAAGMNPNAAGFDQASTYVEERVLAWLKELVGFSPDGAGLLVSGGSMANLVGIATARNLHAGFDVRRDGLAGDSPGEENPRLTLYASTETHSSVDKAVELLGLGRRALRRIPVGEDFTIDLEALARTLDEDRQSGHRPFCVVANAGTVNTGAIDDLAALVRLCREQNLWLHVDGAFGALAALSPRLAPRLDGLGEADSLAFDLHKWLYLPYEAGCVLVRAASDLEAAFAVVPPYLSRVDGGIAGRGAPFMNYGLQLSRSFRALKVWLSLKAEGSDKLARLIEQNVEQAAHLAARVDAHPQLERLAPVPLNVVCFRFVAEGLDPARLDRLNERILVALQEGGLAVPSATRIGGRFALRVAITNHRTRRADLDLVLTEVARLGRRLAAEEGKRSAAATTPAGRPRIVEGADEAEPGTVAALADAAAVTP